MAAARFLTIFGLFGIIHAEDGGLNLFPRYPVRKVGENITFECVSTPYFTGLHSESVKFSLKHGDVEISTMAETDHIEGDSSVKQFAMSVLSQSDAGVYTCIVTPSDYTKTVIVETQLYVVEGTDDDTGKVLQLLEDQTKTLQLIHEEQRKTNKTSSQLFAVNVEP